MLRAFVVAVVSLPLLTACQSFQLAENQGGGCLAGTVVGAAAGGVAGSAIGAGSGQLAAIAGGIALGGSAGYLINPACHQAAVAVYPVAPGPVVYK